MADRLQKILAQAGLGSRREIERWIADGRLMLNGQKAVLGSCATPSDDIRLDGRVLKLPTPSKSRVILYNKPAGELVSRRDPEGRLTVFERLPAISPGRWISIGRLDLNTTGLLLLTNDGALANAMMHPSQAVEREYAVRILGEVDGLMLERLTHGVKLEDGMARFESIRDAGGRGANHWYHVVLREGRNRGVRRLWESQGLTVSRLIRVRYGEINLPPDLPMGHWRELSARQLQSLYKGVKLKTLNHEEH